MARIASILLIIGLSAVAFYYGKNSLRAGDYFELERLEFEGVENFEEEKFRDLFGKHFDDNLLALDLKRVRDLVESETWVKSALVRRKLPDQLIIYVQEREPVAVAAVDDHLYVVDADGVILDSYGPDYSDLDRPIIKGLRNLARENAKHENRRRVQVYLQVLEDLQRSRRDHLQSISEVNVENPERVAVVPEGEGVAVYLGDQSFAERYETFLAQRDLFERLKEKYGLIEYVDVTYDNRIIFHTPNETVSG